MIEMVHVKEIDGIKKIISDNENTVRKTGAVDLGSISWVKSSSYTDVFVSSWTVGKAKEPSFAGKANIECSDYSSATYNQLTIGGVDKSMIIIYSASSLHGQLWIRDSSKRDMTGTQFKVSLSGLYLYYEMTTPVQPSGDPVVLWEAAE